MSETQYQLQDKVAIVTGGGRGIGSEICRQLAAAGASVVVTDIDGASAQQTVQHITEAGGQALAVELDVASESGWQKVIEVTQSQFGKLNILVNNAAIFQSEGVEETSYTSWQKIMGINVDGVFLGIRAAMGMMSSSDQPCSIVTISSVNGLDAGASETCPVYCASKASVRMLSRSVALECGRKGYPIRVNTICPGGIDTPMAREELSEELFAMRQKMHPIGRGGQPNDIARAVIFLSSDDAGFITGTDLVVDGGFTAGYTFGSYPAEEANT